ncbi:type II toxin-antitoxin system HipA family toxin [Nocardia brasiliensis]|uniref:type II toxin-antitoxin system HipA family toxin n=1 Tax=Nocardia brasiliensis TaxID=37326 RepID=UPI00191BD44B|nr:HipA domain-containing protein [Nocardia brasiliensis]
MELYDTRIGRIAGTWRNFDFVADAEAIARFGLDSSILSVSIPLAAIATRGHKARRQNYFRELLPEGRMRIRMAMEGDLAEQDVIGLLRRYGRDVAGALQIWDPDVPGEPKVPGLEQLTAAGVAHMLNNVQDNPLGNKPIGGKTSLAGVQDKIVLARTSDRWNRVIDGYPSTHILKPASRDNPTIIYDEEYGSRFARAAGLAEFDTWIEEFEGTPAVVIERYDRVADSEVVRIHQEDFNQVLGASGDQKYQKFGGRVDLARIAAVLSAIADRSSLERLLRMVTLAVAVGNLDMHAKNISMLHRSDGTATLAPAYDFVPQVHQPNDGEMALAIDGEYRHRAITRAHLVADGQSWGVSDAEQIVDGLLDTVIEVAATESPHPAAHPSLPVDIARFAANLAAGRAAGDS